MKLPGCVSIYIVCLTLLSAILEARDIRKIGFWSTWNISCGIAVYSKHVTDSLLKLGYRVTHYDYRLPPTMIVARAIADQVQVLVIQYEGSIMPPKDILLCAIQQLKHAGIKVVITMHEEPLYAQELVNAAHATIYHKQPQYLRDLSQVRIFPMGVPVFNPIHDRKELRKKYGFNPDDKIIISTGFMLPSKEIDSILKHLAPALKKDQSIKIQLLHALHAIDSQGSQQMYMSVMNVIHTYQLHNQVTLITNFTPQEELSERIYISDIGYQWYNIDTRATSAVAKEYISARTPLVIPDCTHFHDVHYHGIKVTPRSHKEFVRTIIQLLYQPRHLALMRHHLSRLYKRLNYQVMVKKYDDVFQALRFH